MEELMKFLDQLYEKAKAENHVEHKPNTEGVKKQPYVKPEVDVKPMPQYEFELPDTVVREGNTYHLQDFIKVGEKYAKLETEQEISLATGKNQDGAFIVGATEEQLINVLLDWNKHNPARFNTLKSLL